MESKSGKLEYWRSFFSGAEGSIFDAIDYAIAVAAADCPEEFKSRRVRIAERLFTCRLARCVGCERVELATPADEAVDVEAEAKVGEQGSCRAAPSVGKESGMNSCSTGPALEMEMEMNNRFGSYSDVDVEALTDELEEKNRSIEEVMRIRDVLNNQHDESEAALYESLRRLQLMRLSMEELKVTEIGKSVNGLRKHGSKEIRHLVRTLIDEWKNVVDEWVSASAALCAGKSQSPESVNHSVLEEEGLPSPPLDEGAFLATQPTTFELSNFFDGMDDDGNIQDINGGQKAPVPERPNPRRNTQAQSENQITRRKDDQVNKKANVAKETPKPINRAIKPANLEQVSSCERKQVNQLRNESKHKVSSNPLKVGSDRKPPSRSNETSKNSEEMSVHLKLEASKRKLHEGYQQAENAKKQRTIQVMELHDLPKQSLADKNSHQKHGNFNRHFSNGRR